MSCGWSLYVSNNFLDCYCHPYLLSTRKSTVIAKYSTTSFISVGQCTRCYCCGCLVRVITLCVFFVMVMDFGSCYSELCFKTALMESFIVHAMM